VLSRRSHSTSELILYTGNLITCENRPRPETTGCAEALHTAYGWLTHCLQEHDTCNFVERSSGREEFCPSRLIQILPDTIRLHSTHNTRGSSYRYATLSHRWPLDSAQLLQLTTQNINSWHTNMEQTTGFSQVFKDAIAVCKHLKIEFIWIDSLCIIQSGDDGIDWQHEAARMGSVYKHAVCNIAATSAADGITGMSEGFFRHRAASLVTPILLPASRDLDSSTNTKGSRSLLGALTFRKPETMDYHFVPNLWTPTVIDAGLNQRGWVMQERHMSPRILHFTSHQIFWECNETVCSETYPSGDPVSIFQDIARSKTFLRDLLLYLDPSNLDQIYTLWYDLVSIYSRGGLTKNQDKLIALSGIARELHSHAQIPSLTYIAGLWQQDLPYGLLWATPRLREPEINRVRLCGDEANIAPTWSWASVKCKVDVNRRLYSTPHSILAQILESKVVPRSNNIFGEVNPGGFVKIKGTLFDIRLTYDRTPRHEIWPVLHVGLLGYSKKNKTSFDIFPDERFIEGDICARSDLKLLPVLQSMQRSTIHRQRPGQEAWLAALLLEPTGKAYEYKRFGLVLLRGNGSDKVLDGPIVRRNCRPRAELITII
jgi:hypothetical protein